LRHSPEIEIDRVRGPLPPENCARRGDIPGPVVTVSRRPLRGVRAASSELTVVTTRAPSRFAHCRRVAGCAGAAFITERSFSCRPAQPQ
jgi:hypothetical protein